MCTMSLFSMCTLAYPEGVLPSILPTLCWFLFGFTICMLSPTFSFVNFGVVCFLDLFFSSDSCMLHMTLLTLSICVLISLCCSSNLCRRSVGDCCLNRGKLNVCSEWISVKVMMG